MNYFTVLVILLLVGLIYLSVSTNSAQLRVVLILLIVLLVVYYLYSSFFSKTQYLTSGVSDATIQQIISSSTLVSNNTNSQPTNFSYSFWIYVDDWSYKYGTPKPIILRDASLTASSSTVPKVNSGSCIPSPFVYLGSESNTLTIQQAVFPSTGTNAVPGSENIDKIDIENIPLQKWVNVLVSVYGRTLDTYLDGKLVNTHILTNTAYVGNGLSSIYITPSGGFSGYRSNIQYFPNETDPQTAWNIYSSGYSSGSSTTFNNPYTVEVSLYNNGTQQGNYTF